MTSSTGSKTCTYTGPFGAGETDTCQVSGLTIGTSYTYTVTATNQSGTGPASAASNAVVSSTVPNAPTSPSATTGNGSATVSFTGDTTTATEGGIAITGYTVTATDATTPANGGQTATGTASPVTVTGLTNGDSYTFTVHATNANGNGAESTATAAVNPGRPSAPTAVVSGADASSQTTLDVIWAASTSPDGTSPITGYTVTSSPGGFTCTTTGATTLQRDRPDGQDRLHLHGDGDQPVRHVAGLGRLDVAERRLPRHPDRRDASPRCRRSAPTAPRPRSP